MATFFFLQKRPFLFFPLPPPPPLLPVVTDTFQNTLNAARAARWKRNGYFSSLFGPERPGSPAGQRRYVLPS